jgi:hypothetical protein
MILGNDSVIQVITPCTTRMLFAVLWRNPLRTRTYDLPALATLRVSDQSGLQPPTHPLTRPTLELTPAFPARILGFVSRRVCVFLEIKGEQRRAAS